MEVRSRLFGVKLRNLMRDGSNGRLRSRFTPRPLFLEDRRLLSGNVWSQRGGDAGHTSYVDFNVDTTAISPAWNQALNYVSSATGSWAERAVAIDATHVYRTDLDGYAFNGTYHVIAYDLQTGAPAWNRSFIGNAFEGVGEPSVAGGVVYVNRAGHSGISGGTSSDLPVLYGLSSQTGDTVVQTTYAAQWSSNERPAIAGDQLVAWDGYYGGFSSWSASTLTRQWNNSGSIYDKPLAAMDGQNVYAYGNQVYLRSTGARLADITHPAGLTLSDPMVSGTGRLLYEVSGMVGGVSTYGVASYDGISRSLQWTAYTPSLPTAKAAGNGRVAVITGQQLQILDEATGAQMMSWQSPDFLTSELVLTRTHVFVETVSGTGAHVYAINLNTGQPDWSFDNTAQGEAGGTFMEMALGGGHLLLSNDAFVRAFDLASADAPPDAIDDLVATAEDTAVTINVLANDTDPNGDVLTVSAVGSPEHGTVLKNADGTLTYRPSANYYGADHFAYTVSDGRGQFDTATVSLTINPVNDAPIATSWQFGAAEDTPFTSFLRASDVEGDPLRFAIVTSPIHGSIQLNSSTGVFTYTPAANYNGGDQFTFKVNDGTADSNTVIVFMSVQPVNDAPVAQGDVYATGEDQPLVVAPGQGVLANDTDVEGGRLTAALLLSPTKGTLTLNPDGSFSYTPHANANGADSFTYKANDGALDSASATVTLNIRPVQDPPVAAAGPDQAGSEGVAVTFSAAGSSDPDGDSLTYLWNFGDGGTGAGPSLTHVYADNNAYTVTLIVSDGQGNSSSDTLLVTVGNTAPATVAGGPPSGVRGQARTFTFSAIDASPVDQAGLFDYAINWGDGSALQKVRSGSTLSVDHVFTGSGTFSVTASATDKDGGVGPTTLRTIAINAAELQGDTLVVGGTIGDDTITIKPTGSLGDLVLTINGVNQGTYRPTGRILVYGQSGGDTIQLQSTKVKGATSWVGVSAILDGGVGNDTIDAGGSSASNILLGGDGADTLWGGNGREILVGGLGVDAIHGGGDDDIIIGGTTDSDANLVALGGLLSEWSRTDLAYDARIDHLTGVTTGGRNGSNILTSSTVHADAAIDQMYGGGDRDWFLYDTVGTRSDLINDKKSNERTTKV